MISAASQNMRGAGKRRFSLAPQFDQYPWAVAFAQTLPGKIAMLAVFSLLLAVYWPKWVLFIALCLWFCIFFPGRRHWILVAAALGSIVIGRTDVSQSTIEQVLVHFGYGPLSGPLTIVGMAGVVLFCYGLLVSFFSRGGLRGWAMADRPVLLVLSALLALILAVGNLPLAPAVQCFSWIFIILCCKYLWFLCYSLSESRDPHSPPFYRQLGHYLPFWHPVDLPIPKGAAFLAQIKARTPEELAICQLKGLKLLLWAVYLSLFTLLLKAVCFGFGESYSTMFHLIVHKGSLIFYFREQEVLAVPHWPLFLDIPRYRDAFALAASGNPLPFHKNWQALAVNFFILLLHIAITSHAAIAVCRMAGYRALRNVHRPFSATTIAGFWNNYQYYYKELMVTVFFYPTFLRYFKNRPLLRYYAATMAAACLGNFLYHLLVRIDLVITQGLFGAAVVMQSMAFYCFLLGNGIFLSQLRKIKKGPGKSTLPPPVATAGVLLFYCIIVIFGDVEDLPTLTECFRFLLALFGLNLV